MADTAESQTEDHQTGVLNDSLADTYREAYVDIDGGKDVQVEEYPGGDMAIFTKTDGKLYLSSEQASALRTCLGRIDGSKRGDSGGD